MMLSCASLMLKMWHRTVPEPEVVLGDLHTIFSVYKVLATAVHVGSIHGSKIEKEPELVAREVFS